MSDGIIDNGTPATEATPQENTVTNDAWYAGIEDADLKSYAEKKAWKNPYEAVKSYREAEKRLGSSISLPKEGATPEELGDFYKKIGRPDAPEAYDLPLPEGSDPEFANTMSKIMFDSGIPAKSAQALASAWNDYQGQLQTAYQEQQAQAEEQQVQALKSEWGANYEKNEILARNAASAFGVTGDQVDALQSTLGFDGVMKFFNNIASKIGEDKFVGGETLAVAMPSTKADAEAEYRRLISDPQIKDKYIKGDPETIARFDRLYELRMGV